MAEQRQDLTNPKNFFSWVFYGLSGVVAAVSATAYFDMRTQRDKAVERVDKMTDQVWNQKFQITNLKKDSIEKNNVIKYADSTLRDNTMPEAKQILNSRKNEK